MQIVSLNHSENVLEDIRRLYKEEPQTLILMSNAVLQKLKETPNMRIDPKRVLPVSSNFSGAINLIKTSEDSKETDIIVITSQSSNIYNLIYFKSIYVKNTAITTYNLETKRIVIIE